MAVTVSVIVVNWNGRQLLERCLPALLGQSYPDFEIILVDNGSTDGSAEFVSQRFPEIRLIENPANVGFASGNNMAIRIAQGEFIATLNNDTQPEADWLQEIARGMQIDPRIGMCASKMLFSYRPRIINSTGICLDKAGIAWDRHGGEEDGENQDAISEVFGPCAGAALYRRRMLEEVGLFDEDFFAYLEDVDLAWRARLMGWRCIYIPTARVYHLHSATGKEGSPWKNYLLGRNKIWTILKNYPAPEILLLLPAILSYDLAAVLYGLLTRGDTSSLRGRVAACCDPKRVLAKRREIQSKRTISFATLSRSMSPLENPLKVLGRYRHLREFSREEQGTA